MSDAPRLLDQVRILPFEPGGESADTYLVENGDRSFLINRRTECLLQLLREPLSLIQLRGRLSSRLQQSVEIAELRKALAGLPPSLFAGGISEARSTPFHVAFTLLPAPMAGRCARVLASLYRPWIVGLVVTALLVESPLLVRGFNVGSAITFGASEIVSLVAVGIVTVLFHELGHAAACAWYGLAPGAIGCGLYLIFPSFYADATRAWRLAARQRAVVDLGGIYFQSIMLAAIAPLLTVPSMAPGVALAIFYNACLAVHNLNPLFKRDGYWLVSDLAGLPNLHRAVWNQLRRLAGRSLPVPSGGAWRQGRGARRVLPIYCGLLVVCVVVLAMGLPPWWAVHFEPYPRILAERTREFAAAWSAGNTLGYLGAVGQIVAASFLPGVVAMLGASWATRAVRSIWKRPSRRVAPRIASEATVRT